MPSRSPVRVLVAGAGLSLGGCAAREPALSPPPPAAPAAPPAAPAPTGPAPGPDASPATAGPPGASEPPAPPPATGGLPTWDEVPSTHPSGATNPPMPVLVVTEDGRSCFKHWQSPMVPDRDLMRLGGKVVPDVASAPGTPIVCPQEKAEALLAAWRAAVPPKPPGAPGL